MATKIEITESGAKAFLNGKQIGSVLIETVIDNDNDRILSLIESADVEETYQHKGVYTDMLREIAKTFEENQFFCSIGRSYEAACFWSKITGLSLDQTEAGIEKDQQERALIINADLELISNEYSPDLFELFW